MECETKERAILTLAIATVPWQRWRNVMDPGCALQKGTIFEELDLPFYGIQAACDENFARKRTAHQEQKPYAVENSYSTRSSGSIGMKRNNTGRSCGCR